MKHFDSIDSAISILSEISWLAEISMSDFFPNKLGTEKSDIIQGGN